MPSNALNKFEKVMLKDVDRLIESHALLNTEGRGRRAFGHITRSGVLMLCASWELYVEELAIEMSSLLAERASSPYDLPKPVQKELAKLVKGHKEDLKPLELAGAGWEKVYVDHAKTLVAGLNTPKAGPVDLLYAKTVGWECPSASWSLGGDFVNEFVKARGDIAHRGSNADYVKILDLRDKFLEGIKKTVVDHDNAACDFVLDNTKGDRPWRRRT